MVHQPEIAHTGVNEDPRMGDPARLAGSSSLSPDITTVGIVDGNWGDVCESGDFDFADRSTLCFFRLRLVNNKISELLDGSVNTIGVPCP